MKGIKNICKQLAIAAACFLFIIGNIVPVQAANSGKTGKVKWNLSNGILVISGNGAMANYTGGNQETPWYEYRNEITKVVIEKGVTHVGESAFFECTSLTSVTMADSVKSIGPLAFLKCKNLMSVELSNKLQSIGHGAFKQCKSLTMISLPKSLKSIDYEAFFDCKSLKSITIPSSVTYLGSSVFTYCNSLIQAKILCNIQKIPAWTFYGCTNLKSLTLSPSIKEVGEDAFNDCDNLDTISGDVPDNVIDEVNDQTGDTVVKDDPSSDDTSSDDTSSDDSSSDDSSSDDSSSDDTSSDLTNHKNDEVTENSDAIFNGTFNKKEIVLNVTIKASNGWEMVFERVDDYLKVKEKLGITKNIQLNVTLETNIIDEIVFEHLAGKPVDLFILGKHNVKISFDQINSNQDFSSFKLGYELKNVDKLSKNMINVIGDTKAFTLKFNGSGNIKMTVIVSLGKEFAYQNASIYQKDGNGYNYIQNVQIDSNGNANFYFEYFDNFTTYLIGLNVDGENPLIPDSLHNDYGGLMDEHGNKYEITGVKSKWGIDIVQLTWIVAGVLVFVIAMIGAVMFMMNKRRIVNEKIRQEVMSESYSKENHIKNYKFMKKGKK